MKVYEYELDREKDFREHDGVPQILLDGIWYNVPAPGAAQIITLEETFQAVMMVGPWLVPMEPVDPEIESND